MATLTTEKGELKTKEDKKLIGSETKERLLTAIEGGVQAVYERAQEDDPTSLSDEAARLGVGTAELVGNVAGAPVIKQTLSVLDFPFWVARQSAGGILEHGFGVDPFYGQAAVGVGEVFVGGKGLVSGVTKGTKLARKGAFATKYAVQETVDAARSKRLARKGKLWQRPGSENMPIDRSDVFKADDLSYGRGPQKKTYTQTHPRTVYPDPKSIPDDPWWKDDYNKLNNTEEVLKQNEIQNKIRRATGQTEVSDIDALTQAGVIHRIMKRVDGQGDLFDDATDLSILNDTPAPTPRWGPEALKQAMIDPRYADQYVEYLQASGKTGYETLKLFKTNILNKMPDKGKQLFRLFNEADYREGMIEHLVAKGAYMDWYWEPWGLNKGDRHALSNVRILFNDRFDRFKTTVEGIIRNPKTGYQSSPNLADRIIVGVENAGQELKNLPGIKVQDIRNPGDIVLKRAGSGKVLGKLGQYLDALYPQGKAARKLFLHKLEIHEGVKGGKAVIEWRKKVLTERINKIVEKHGDLPKKDWLAREKIQDAINEDMIEFHAKYPWLPQPTKAKKYFKEVSTEKTGPIPSKTETIQGTIKGSSGLPGGG